ncbi:MAG: hypothetical protein J7J92_02855 [Candidatus Aenigmarchaeota archaeon]|nr:hypothetical protein [Candidatus Aenigmarchaeota archaeon]
MKGQIKIVNELLIFAIGMGIAVVIILIFQTVRDVTSQVAIKDQTEEVGNLISSYILKANQSNAYYEARLQIPEKIGGHKYYIDVKDKDGEAVLTLVSSSGYSFSQELFNIDKNKIITEKIASSAKYISISSDKNRIYLNRQS